MADRTVTVFDVTTQQNIPIKLHDNGDGTYSYASYSGGGTVDTELPTAALLADNTALPTTPIVGAALMGYDGTTLDLLRTKGTGWQGVALVRSSDGTEPGIITDADGQAAQVALAAAARGYLYNGATFDRQRGNTEGTLLASAARTATTASPTQTNYNARGVVVWMFLSAYAGATTFQIRLRGIEPMTGINLWTLTVATIAAPASSGRYGVLIYPGVATQAIADGTLFQFSGALPRTWFAEVVHSDATAQTYSLGYSLIV